MSQSSTEVFGLWKDPASFLTHFAGFVFALVGMVVLVALSPGPWLKTVSFALYGGSLALLFLASSAYHFFDLGERRNLWLRRLDHSAIFLLIGGTYAPMMVHLLDGPWRVGMLVAIGVIALFGVIFKLTWFHAPRWVDAGMYLGMGWLVVLPGSRVFGAMTPETLAWTVAGGVLYTVGAVVYALKWPDPWPEKFGFHDVWHLFVLAAAAAHFKMVWTMVAIDVPA
jgi:hemolysin III